MSDALPPGVIAVTGATGALGSRVASLLSACGVEVALVARDPSRLPLLPNALVRGPASYADGDAMRVALRGASTLFLVSGGLSPRRFDDHVSAIDAAVDSGVERVIYVSLVGAAPDATFSHAVDHWQTEQYLAAQPVRWTVLRPSIYVSMLAARADAQGVIRGPGGEGRFAPVAHDDIAEVAATVLTADADSPPIDGAVLEITGPQTVSMAQAAGELTRALGPTFSYQPETVTEAIRRLSRTADAAEVDRWVSWFQAIEHGEFGSVTDVVPRYTGHPALTIADALTPGAPQ